QAQHQHQHQPRGAQVMSYPCPNTECDVFPFDNVADLEAHVANGDHTNPQARAFIPTVSARFENRTDTFTPGAKPARAAAARPTGEGRPEKQRAFLAKLIAEGAVEVDLPPLRNTRAASALIDPLLKTPKAAKPAAAAAAEVPEGLHLYEVYKVQCS